MRTIGVSLSVFRNSFTQSNTKSRLEPRLIARSDARCITGPSAIGPENGMPSSIALAPDRTSSCKSGTVDSSDGSPAQIYGIRAFFPAA